MFFLVIRLKFNFLTRRAERWRKCWPIIARVQACVLSHCCCVWLFVDCRLLCPWDFPGKNTGVGCHALLQEMFLTQGLNPHLLHLLRWQAGYLPLTPPGKPYSESTCCQHDLGSLSESGTQLFLEPKLEGLLSGWLCIPMHGAWVQSLVRELNPTCHN